MNEVIHIVWQEQFQKEVLDYKWVVVLDFRAEWCGPCRMIGPVMERLAETNAEKWVKIVKINVDENQDLAWMFQVSSIPAVFFVKNGETVANIVWANPPTVYQEQIDELLK